MIKKSHTLIYFILDTRAGEHAERTVGGMFWRAAERTPLRLLLVASVAAVVRAAATITARRRLLSTTVTAAAKGTAAVAITFLRLMKKH